MTYESISLGMKYSETGPFKGLLFFLILSPGWFAYFALIWAAIGRRLPGDPFTTWFPCVVINWLWFFLIVLDTDYANLESKAYSYIWVRIYIVTAVIGGIIGFIVELGAERRQSQVEHAQQ